MLGNTLWVIHNYGTLWLIHNTFIMAIKALTKIGVQGYVCVREREQEQI